MNPSLSAWALIAAGVIALAHAASPAPDAGCPVGIPVQADPVRAVHVNGQERALGVVASNQSPAVHGKGQYPAAEKACLEAVSRKTRVHRSKLKITDVSSAQAGVGVTVRVPGAEAPWSCLANRKGRVQGVSYTGDEGRL